MIIFSYRNALVHSALRSPHSALLIRYGRNPLGETTLQSACYLIAEGKADWTLLRKVEQRGGCSRSDTATLEAYLRVHSRASRCGNCTCKPTKLQELLRLGDLPKTEATPEQRQEVITKTLQAVSQKIQDRFLLLHGKNRFGETTLESAAKCSDASLALYVLKTAGCAKADHPSRFSNRQWRGCESCLCDNTGSAHLKFRPEHFPPE